MYIKRDLLHIKSDVIYIKRDILHIKTDLPHIQIDPSTLACKETPSQKRRFICICIYTYTCIYVHTGMYIHICIYIYVHTRMYMHACVCVCVCLYVYAHVCVCVCVLIFPTTYLFANAKVLSHSNTASAAKNAQLWSLLMHSRSLLMCSRSHLMPNYGLTPTQRRRQRTHVFSKTALLHGSPRRRPSLSGGTV